MENEGEVNGIKNSVEKEFVWGDMCYLFYFLYFYGLIDFFRNEEFWDFVYFLC